jgi:hypothetical protein
MKHAVDSGNIDLYWKIKERYDKPYHRRDRILELEEKIKRKFNK